MPVTKPTRKFLAQALTTTASRYTEAAFVFQTIGKHLLERLSWLNLSPSHILDLGCATGIQSIDLANRFPEAQVYGLDIAERLLREAKQNALAAKLPSCPIPICADAEHLPFRARCFDLISANGLQPWIAQPRIFYERIEQLLKPDGVFLFTAIGPDTLQELRYSFAQMDPYTHLHPFEDMHVFGDELLAAGLRDPVVDREMLCFDYPSVEAILQDLKDMGAQNLHPERPKHLLPTNYHRQLANHYPTQAADNGLNIYPVSVEVIYGIAWGPSPRDPLQVHISHC